MSSDRIHAVEQACTDLAAAGAPVTFVTVASRSGIPRVTLYRNPALRAVVLPLSGTAWERAPRAAEFLLPAA